MSKKVVNIVKKGKKDKELKKTDEIFNLNEEIIIGINSNKDSDIKKNKTNKKQNKKNNQKKLNEKNTLNRDLKKQDREKNVLKKPHKKINKVLKVFLILFLLIATIAALLMSPIFNITKITVKNNTNVTKDEIISLSRITLNQNMFKYINYNLINNIKQNSYIEDVKISRKYPSEIVIDVAEREITFFIKLANTNAFIDNQGYIVDISNNDIKVPEVIGFKTDELNFVKGNRLMNEDLLCLEKIITLYDYARSNDIADKIISFTISEKRIIIALDGDKTAYIENFNNLNIKILSLKSILERTEGKAGEIYLDGQGQNNSILFNEKV